jgi:predicted nucleic acid-binding protein
MIVLDTSILSLVFRRQDRGGSEPRAAATLRALIAADAPLAVPGIVLQELLSGVRSEQQFRKLREALAGFPLLLADERHHAQAAEIANACRRQGIACSTVDALIAALTIAENGQLFTADADFARLAPACGLKLFRPPA